MCRKKVLVALCVCGAWATATVGTGTQRLFAQPQIAPPHGVVMAKGGVFVDPGPFSLPTLEAAIGSSIFLDASYSTDPSDLPLQHAWWVGRFDRVAGTFLPWQTGLGPTLRLNTNTSGREILMVVMDSDNGASDDELVMVVTVRPFSRIRGDANSDGSLDLSDSVAILDYLFSGGSPPLYRENMDADSSGGINLSDSVYIINHLFEGGPAPGPVAGSGTPFNHDEWSTFYE